MQYTSKRFPKCKNPNYKNDKNPFSFLMKYFYNPHRVPYGQIFLHRLPPTHPSGLVTPMTLVFFLMPQLSSKFEWMPLNPKCNLVVDSFRLIMSYFHSSTIESDFFIEYSIIVVIECMESHSKWHTLSS